MLTFNFRVRDSRIGQKKTEDYTLVQFQSIFFNLHDPHLTRCGARWAKKRKKVYRLCSLT